MMVDPESSAQLPAVRFGVKRTHPRHRHQIDHHRVVITRAVDARNQFSERFSLRPEPHWWAHVRSQLGDKVGAESDFDRYAKLVVNEEGGVEPENAPTIVAR